MQALEPGTDVRPSDAGQGDAGQRDAGRADAGPTDAGGTDASPPDAGVDAAADGGATDRGGPARPEEPTARYPSLRELARALLELAEPAVRAEWAPAFVAGARPSTPSAGPAADPFAGTIGVASSSSAPSAPASAAAESGGPASMPPPSAAPADVRLPLRRRAPLFVAAVAALGIAGGAVAWSWRAEPSAAPVAIEAVPPTAVIELDGQRAGTGRATIELDERPRRLRVSASGHRPFERTVRASAPPPSRIELEPEVAPLPEGVDPAPAHATSGEPSTAMPPAGATALEGSAPPEGSVGRTSERATAGAEGGALDTVPERARTPRRPREARRQEPRAYQSAPPVTPPSVTPPVTPSPVTSAPVTPRPPPSPPEPPAWSRPVRRGANNAPILE